MKVMIRFQAGFLGMSPLPPLDCLRFFEAAARHQSFARAGAEFQVSAAAVAYRVKVLENHLGQSLFDRTRKGVTLNSRGKACLGDVQRILSDVRESLGRYGSEPQRRRLRVVAVESAAERWLMPKIESFSVAWPDITIELETDHLGFDPNQQDFDVWITYDGGNKGPSSEMTLWETLFEDALLPVCSPALFGSLGRPHGVQDLHTWPLLYHLGWPALWSEWFTAQGAAPPDLSHASGFRLCSMVLHATLRGMGAAIGLPMMIQPELEQGTLVPLFEQHTAVRQRCCLITTAAARRKPEVRAFREWILKGAASPSH